MDQQKPEAISGYALVRKPDDRDILDLVVLAKEILDLNRVEVL